MRTGLPYDIERVFELVDSTPDYKLVVDMSDIHFPSDIENVEKTTMIYLRNTGYNVELDFSNCDYGRKERLLYEYLFGQIYCDLKELSLAWIAIIKYYVCGEYSDYSILNEQELKSFCQTHKDRINELVVFYVSLPIFLFKRLGVADISFSDIPKQTTVSFNGGVQYLLSTGVGFSEWIIRISDKYIPHDFVNVFTLDNNELFESLLKYTEIPAIFYGITQTDWSTMINAINDTLSIGENQ